VLALGLWAAGVHAVGPYIAVVAVSSLVCGAVGTWLVARWGRHAPEPSHTDDSVGMSATGGTIAHEVGGVVVAMLCMQVLLNSGIVVAGAAGSGADAVVAGHLLAALTLARLPVFVLQAAQAAYVARIAGFAHRREHAALRRLLLLIAGVVLAMAGATVAVSAGVGQELVRLVFGPQYEVSQAAVTLVASGIAAYLVASVSNDVAVALGAHRWAGPAWVCALLTAAVVALAVPDLILRSTLPLFVGSLTAAAILVPVVVRRARVGAPAW
jgi:O-antigen/teichoic acid export membrane protein